MECGVFSAALAEGFSPTGFAGFVKNDVPSYKLEQSVGLKPSAKAALKTPHSKKQLPRLKHCGPSCPDGLGRSLCTIGRPSPLGSRSRSSPTRPPPRP